jgi:hypothetical protein
LPSPGVDLEARRAPESDEAGARSRSLATNLGLPQRRARALFWQPKPIDLAPFGAWSTSGTRLAWWGDYNNVKHNRIAEFHKASLENVVNAVAGVFVLLASLGGIRNFGPGEVSSNDHTIGKQLYHFAGVPFRLVLDPSENVIV